MALAKFREGLQESNFFCMSICSSFGLPSRVGGPFFVFFIVLCISFFGPIFILFPKPFLANILLLFTFTEIALVSGSRSYMLVAWHQGHWEWWETGHAGVSCGRCRDERCWLLRCATSFLRGESDPADWANLYYGHLDSDDQWSWQIVAYRQVCSGRKKLMSLSGKDMMRLQAKAVGKELVSFWRKFARLSLYGHCMNAACCERSNHESMNHGKHGDVPSEHDLDARESG